MNNQSHHLDILQHFVFNNTEFEVTILWENEEPLFNANAIAKVLDMKKIRNALLNFDSDEKVARLTGTLGGTQEMLYLTEIGLYRLLFNSRKPIAKPFQKWVAKVIRDIQRNRKYEVENLQNELALAKSNEEKSIREAKHKTLLDAFHKRRVVYFGKIRDINGKNLIKLGATKNIRKTFLERHPKDYGSIHAIHAIESEQNVDFEFFLLHHSYIKQFLYREPVKLNGTKSIETILVSTKELEKIFRIVNRNAKKFPKAVVNNVKLESLEIQLDEIKQLLIKSIKNDLPTIESSNDDTDISSEKLLLKMPSPKKKIRKRIYEINNGKCNKCGIDISITAKRCVNCFERKKKFKVSKEDLYDLVWNQKIPFTKIGKMYGVSDNAIRKRCKSLGIEVRKTKNVKN